MENYLCPDCGNILFREYGAEEYWCKKCRKFFPLHVIQIHDLIHHPSMDDDSINHPSHYTSRGIECIQVTEMFNFCRGNAIKYIWRAGEKSKDTEIEDLKKAVWYLEREIKRLGSEK